MADNITILDSTGATITMATTDTAGVHTPKHIVTSCALPTGASTSAKQDTIIGHVDGIETALASIDAYFDTEISSIVSVLGTIDADTGILSGLVLATQTDDLANTTDGLMTSSMLYVFDGSTWDRLRGTSADGMLVNLGTNNDVVATQSGVWTAVPVPAISGGLSIARDIDLDNGALTVVKGSAGQLYGFNVTNRGTVPVYIKFYDAVSGTLGTGTPVLTFEIPGNATDHTVMMQSFGGHGLAFATGISVGAGTGIADADNTDPGANIVLANIFFK